jgi:hypothetical protein
MGLISGIAGAFMAHSANKKLDKLYSQDPTYTENPIAGQRMALAKMLLNARMPGAASMERNIYTNEANQNANIGRYAADGSQALALGAGAQGQADDSFAKLGLMEQQDYQRRYSNLSNAQEGMINEGDKMYNDRVRRFGDLAQIRSMQQQNRNNVLQSIGNFEDSAMNFGLSGGLSGLLGGGNKGGNGNGGGGNNFNSGGFQWQIQ